MRTNIRRAFAGAATLAIACSTTLSAAVRSVTLRTEDGVTLAAAYYQPAHVPAPGIVLVHMLTRSKEDWQDLASKLVDAGFAVLAIDLRGHGGSSGGSRTEDAGMDASPMILDVKAARAFFNGRPEVVGGRLGMAGASIGANLALLASADDAAVCSLVLLSPGLDYRGLKAEAALRKYGDRPALLVAGLNDPYARRSVKELSAIGPGLREAQTIEAGGHGTALLTRAPNLAALLVDWFKRTLL